MKKHILFAAGNADTQLRSVLPVIENFRSVDEVSTSILYTAAFMKTERDTNPLLEHAKTVSDDFIELDTVAVRTGSYLGGVQAALNFQREVVAVLKKMMPSLVVVPNNKIYRNRFISNACVLLGIRVVEVQDTLNPGGMGNLAAYSSELRRQLRINKVGSLGLTLIGLLRFFGLRGAFGLKLGHAAIHKVAVWGQASQRIAINNGYSRSQVEITGQPRFDRIHSTDWTAHDQKTRDTYSIGVEERVVLYLPTKGITSQYFASTDEQIDMYEQLSESLQAINDAGIKSRLIIKLHRDEDMEVFTKLVGSILPEDAIVVQSAELYPLLSLAAVSITTASTAGLEALLFGTPLVILNSGNRPDFYPFSTTGPAVAAANAEGLKMAIMQQLDCSPELARRIDKFCRDETFEADGLAHGRVFDLTREALTGT